MAQVVDGQGDPLDSSTDTQPKGQDEIKKYVYHTDILLGMMSMGGNQVFRVSVPNSMAELHAGASHSEATAHPCSYNPVHLYI